MFSQDILESWKIDIRELEKNLKEKKYFFYKSSYDIFLHNKSNEEVIAVMTCTCDKDNIDKRLLVEFIWKKTFEH